MAYGRPVFHSPPDRRAEAEAARRALIAGGAAARSDHLAVVAAFGLWEKARAKGGRRAAAEVCPDDDQDHCGWPGSQHVPRGAAVLRNVLAVMAESLSCGRQAVSQARPWCSHAH